ncbi:hypothetical protein GobsT_33980 [Gemmata obscuriglobus]|uniref:Outer membrane lipoprotein-sorting protein n=1 Tax=Gemmata obscuriglobus TaxID=114 RepID=A0A2Z3H9V3_9BACT|nr:hypothetical protein [Gemmata obscuriglobus]AWM38454.1 hypothetical protein C1280_16630 [Gemmata obscuriglobus]QEG28615.1 hypothetical protein GobsT_33980 [Gemmata obscuriglobus]VTS06786.1 unnamed protein product [Gemmata obscuriglobus UQM 2246]
MKRYGVGAVLFGFALSLAGCGPEKVLPTDLLKPGSGPVPSPVPTKSDPEALAVIDQAVKAFTGGKPDLLAKGKYCRVAMKGLMYSVDSSNQSDAVRTYAAAWPDRLHVTNDSESFGSKRAVASWLRRPEFVITSNGTEVRPPNPAEVEQNLASDLVGQLWMAFLLPATDPKAVVFDPQTISLDSRELKLVKLSLGEYPVYQLFFDTKSNALVRVEYTITATGVPRRTTMIFAEHKPGPDGLLLPYRLECLHNKSVVEKWTVEKWEFPETIKDDEFMPKKK